MAGERKTIDVFHVTVGRTLNPADRQEVEVVFGWPALREAVKRWAARGYFVDSLHHRLPIAPEAVQMALEAE